MRWTQRVESCAVCTGAYDQAADDTHLKTRSRAAAHGDVPSRPASPRAGPTAAAHSASSRRAR